MDDAPINRVYAMAHSADDRVAVFPQITCLSWTCQNFKELGIHRPITGTDQIDVEIYAKAKCRRKRTFLSAHIVEGKAAFPQRMLYDFLEIGGFHRRGNEVMEISGLCS